LTNQPNKIIQEALTNCTVWVADYSKIVALYERHHEMERIGRKVAEYFYLEKERNLVEMALYDADKRYSFLKDPSSTIPYCLLFRHLSYPIKPYKKKSTKFLIVFTYVNENGNFLL